MNLFQKISLGVIGLVAVAGVFLGLSSHNQQIFGGTANNPSVSAVFETSLATPLGASDSSLTLATNSIDSVGDVLPNVYTCFTVDQGQPNNEFLCGTVNGASVTGLVRGVSPITGTTTVASLGQSHRRGADVKITDWPTLGILNNQANGVETFPNLLTYSTNVLIQPGSPSSTIATKYYVDNISVAGAPNATTLVKGIVQLATAAQAVLGTILGSTGAALDIPNSLATSTPTASCSVACIPVAVGGKLSQLFLDIFSTNNTWAGTQLFNGNATFAGNVTLQGTINVTDGAFGAGTDGNVTIAAPTTLTRDMYYNNLVLNSSLNENGFKVFVRGTISGAGTLQEPTGVAGGVGSAGSGTTGGAAGSGTATSTGGTMASAGAGGSGGAGANASSNGGVGIAGGGVFGIHQSNGSAGGTNFSPSHTSGPGGPGGVTTGTSTNLTNELFTLAHLSNDVSTTTNVLTFYSSSGGGGGGGGGEAEATAAGGGGGGGGASALPVFLAAYNWSGTFTIQAIGGNGGNGGNSTGTTACAGAGGGGGNGGDAWIYYGTKTWTGSFALTGGTAGSFGTTVGSCSGGSQIPATAGSAGLQLLFFIGNL